MKAPLHNFQGALGASVASLAATAVAINTAESPSGGEQERDATQANVFAAVDAAYSAEAVKQAASIRSLQENAYMLSSAVYSLGSTGVKWAQAPANTVRNISHAVSAFSPMHSRDVSMLLWGLAKMELQWSATDPVMKASLLKSLQSQQLFAEATSQTVATVIYSLGSLGALWTQLPNSNLGRSITDFHADLTPMDLSNVVFGLWRMEARWKHLTFHLQMALLLSVKSNIEKRNIFVSALSAFF